MDIQKEIESLRGTIKQHQERIRWLRKHAKEIKDLPEGRFFTGTLDFDNLSHAEVIKVVRGLGGKWAKSVNCANDKRIDYTRTVDGIEVRCWSGEPPPSCRIVEVEEQVPEKIIPAHTVKVRKMVCTGQAEPIAVELARLNSSNNQTATPTT